MSPVAAGGYFWVFFSSRRSYGNRWSSIRRSRTGGQEDLGGRDRHRGRPAAIRAIPLYLANQELESGNLRAFAALEPCRDEGAMCSSGMESCCGYCVDEPGASQGQCGCEPDRCSHLDERWTAADCCTRVRPASVASAIFAVE